ncbi:hypothetical protein ABN228_19580 [Providencia rettgeri]|uniref:hypothetical protein n=1 Tax=Providencia rettgeri TaxID=587 RepID=UPI0032DB5F0E
MRRYSSLPAVSAMLVASICSTDSWAGSCEMLRGYFGGEGISSHSSSSLWQFKNKAFRNNSIINTYMTAVGSCTLTDFLSFKTQVSGEYAFQDNQPGALEDKKNEGLALLNEAVLSWMVNEALYIDVGKLRTASGNLFSVSPVDLLRSTSSYMRSIRVNELGDRWRSFYSEGAYGGSATLYRYEGTYIFWVLPRLTSNKKLNDSAVNWGALDRTNSTDRYYASYTNNGLKNLNTTYSLLGGDQKTFAVGISGNLTDRLILSVESSVSHGETWRHLDMASARQIRDLRYISDPYKTRSSDIEGDLGISLRYTSDNQTEYGAEYYGQSQGYSRGEWKDVFNTIKFVNGGYRNAIPAYAITPSVSSSYEQYSRMMAAEIDNSSRKGNLQGKHYATLYMRTNKEKVGQIDWAVSGTTNLVDHSYVMNLHLSTPLKNNFLAYTGVSACFGSKNSEFGTFGEKGNGYAGMQFSW